MFPSSNCPFFASKAFLADRAHDTNELFDMLKEADIAAVIPPVKSRKEQKTYKHELYRARHVIESVSAPSSASGELPRAAQSSPLPYRRHSYQVFVPPPSSSPYLGLKPYLMTNVDGAPERSAGLPPKPSRRRSAVGFIPRVRKANSVVHYGVRQFLEETRHIR
ncbi:transposase [Treponema endosymbiont of Eucomonympha sp.]|uniref:transposase n=1 Tax=Treponema endosymbiont of Eucomonympha sp. TaxID=1580831 RepID=UPI000A70AFF8|nr:transposase [Treponema endosymbiont of Eucomonympha sp.]